MIYYHNSNYPEIIRFKTRIFQETKQQQKQQNKHTEAAIQLLLSTNCCCFFIFSSSIIILFFRLRTQLIAGSLISLFFLLFTIIFMMKKMISNPTFHSLLQTPFHRYRPPYNQLFLHEKTCFITQYHYCYFSHFVLQKQNKTKKTYMKKKNSDDNFFIHE